MFEPFGQQNFMPYQYPMQPVMPQYQPQQGDIQGIRFVNGIEEARSCVLPYGTTAILMDSEKSHFYLKEMDRNGVSTVTEYEFREVPKVEEPQYITRNEFEELKQMIASLGGNNESTASETTAATAANTNSSAEW